MFISYKREDRDAADAAAKIFEAAGLDVWIDRESLGGGEAFGPGIEAALGRAAAVVVLWSERSVASDFVRDEAARAKKRGVLVTARIDGVEPPVGFGALHTHDLSDWDRATASHAEFARLLKRIQELTGARGRTSVIRALASRTTLYAVLATLGIVLFLGWLGHRWSWIVTICTVAVVAALALTLALLGRSGDIRAAARRLCSPRVSGCLCSIGLAAWSWIPVRVEADPRAAGMLEVEMLRMAERIAGPVAFGTNGMARMSVFAWQGSALRLRVTGHSDLDVTLRPWSGARFSLEKFRADPTVIIRISPDFTRFVHDARLEVLEGGRILAEVMLTKDDTDRISAIFGPKPRVDLDKRLAAWEQDVVRDMPEAADRRQLVALWGQPAAAPWKSRPSSVFGTIQIRLTTKANQSWICDPIELRGEETDEKVAFRIN